MIPPQTRNTAITAVMTAFAYATLFQSSPDGDLCSEPTDCVALSWGIRTHHYHSLKPAFLPFGSLHVIQIARPT